MKRALCFLMILLSFSLLCSCKNNLQNNDVNSENVYWDHTLDPTIDAYFNTFENFEYTFKEITEKDKNYIIYKSNEHAGNFYEIFDNYGNYLDKGYHGYRGSFDISKKDNIVQLEYGVSGTNVFPTYRFYDIEKSKVSRYFSGPIATTDNLVAYFVFDENETTLVVQDMFDIDKTYKEFTGKFNERIYMDINEMYFSNDATQIIINYSNVNSKDDIVEEKFNLY